MISDPQPRPTHCDHCRQRLPATGPLYTSNWDGRDLCRACAEREQDHPGETVCRHCQGSGKHYGYPCNACDGTGHDL